MSQSKKGSLAEAIVNTAIGFAINFVANLIVLPMFGLPIKPSTAFHMGLVFTVISVGRGYWVRRLFNHPKFAAFLAAFNRLLRTLRDIRGLRLHLEGALRRLRQL